MINGVLTMAVMVTLVHHVQIGAENLGLVRLVTLLVKRREG